MESGQDAKTQSPKKALAIVRRAIAAEPNDIDHWRAYVAILARTRRIDITPQLIAELAFCLDEPLLATAAVRRLATNLFLRHPAVMTLLNTRDRMRFANFEDTLATPGFRDRLSELSHPVVTRLITIDRIADRDAELFLSTLRRHLLEAAALDSLDSLLWRKALDLLCALAIQAFTNEYAWLESDAEKHSLAVLIDTATKGLEDGSVPARELVALIAAYRPLFRLDLAGPLRRTDAVAETPLWSRLLSVQIDEPMEELRIRKSIAALTPIRDRVSHAVRQQYEDNPYPRWIHPAPVEATKPCAYVAASLAGAGASIPSLPDAPSILVAGCGTGREPIELAMSLPSARITGVDLSLSSLSYAIRKAASLGIVNITFGQADILELGCLGRRFDMIVSSGVLHHLRQPKRGLAALAACLKPGGIMNLALYSKRARGFVSTAQAFIAKQGHVGTDDGMRRGRFELLALPPNHPAHAVTQWRDFYTLSSCRDLLFHVQEHRFTPKEIDGLIRAAGFRFLGFRGLEARILDAYRHRFPQDAAAVDLDLWEEFEADHPETFVGMYKFWVAKG